MVKHVKTTRFVSPFGNIMHETVNWINLRLIRINYRSQVSGSVTECRNICWTPGSEGSYKFMLVCLCIRVSACVRPTGTRVGWTSLSSFFLKFVTMMLRIKKNC